MYRTDKDRPYRVQVLDETQGSHVEHDHRNGVCEADEYRPRYFLIYADSCWYTLGSEHAGFWRWQDSPPAWYRKAVWYAPERTRERNELRRAVAEYNSGDWDEFEFDFPNYQHRHGAEWTWF